MEYMDSGSKKLPSSMTDELLKWTDAYKEHTYPNGWPKERPHWSRGTLSREPPKQLGTHNMPTDQMEKSTYGLDWLQKRILFGPAKLNNELLQNVKNIRWSQKLFQENNENLDSGIDS